MLKPIIANCFSFFVLINAASLIATDLVAAELVTGSVVGRNIYGLAHDVNGDPLRIAETPLIFKTEAFNKKISSIDGVSFSVSGFGDVIGGLYLSKYDADAESYIDTSSFDLSSVGGLSRPRGGVITSWSSVLFSEAALVNGADSAAFIEGFSPYYKGKTGMVEPYNYGWVVEAIVLDGKGTAKLIKNYSVGRLFASQLYMMPDGKSLYLFDAENAGQLYFYVANVPESLTDGTLYGVSFVNKKAVYDRLGSTSALKMKFKLKKIGFDELFDTSPLKNGGCVSGFNHIVTIYGEECLKQKKKNESYTGLFEPLRTLAIKSKAYPKVKLTGVVYNQDKNQLELTSADGASLNFSLGHNDKLSSRYVIEEVQR